MIARPNQNVGEKGGEKSALEITRKVPDYAVESRAALNRSVFRPELQHNSCHNADAESSEQTWAEKEIPTYSRSLRRQGFME